MGILLGLPAMAEAASGGGGAGGGSSAVRPGEVYQVPWRSFGPKQPAPAHGWVLYWFPASEDDAKRSGMRTSRDLTLFAAQDITMVIADRSTPVAQTLTAPVQMPLAVLTDSFGRTLGRIDGKKGALRASVVEKWLRDVLRQWDEVWVRALAAAKAKATAGDTDGAIAGYQSVRVARNVFPQRAREAAQQLKMLGVTVASDRTADAAPFPVRDPIFYGPIVTKVVGLMEDGFQAELAGRYGEARTLYARAHQLDPADPTPARFLGELYRHQTGEWDKARQVFEELLARPADPLARAVALHGLGKMAIRDGAGGKGVQLMEDSVKVFPTALACRGLAVFFNSEQDPEKVAVYVEQALKLEPDDAFNRTFAAVFYASGGRREEALQIARANEALLPASYNLAAIYALAGDRDKALAFLRRHFHEYERYPAVRVEDMTEARVDEAFVSLRADPEFLKLTALADGRLPLKAAAH